MIVFPCFYKITYILKKPRNLQKARYTTVNHQKIKHFSVPKSHFGSYTIYMLK